MAFVDEITLELQAGNGGSGVVRWRREKFAPKGGPAGGNGGRGGDVYLEAVSDLTILARYRGKKEFSAQDGEDGGSSRKHGKDGDDFTLKVPSGSFVTNLTSGATYDLTLPGQHVRVLRSGGGGRGNASFASSRNRSPEQSTAGKHGEQARFFIELRLVVDVGLIGLPNAGKSSVLNELTSARARVGAYPFTTLEPNLGMLDGRVLADIPGLIEGAAKGRGLGTKFLRHIQRTRLLCHCISLEHMNMERAYRTIRKELEQYGRGLAGKPEVILLTKTDLADGGKLRKAKRALGFAHCEILMCSMYDYESIMALRKRLVSLSTR